MRLSTHFVTKANGSIWGYCLEFFIGLMPRIIIVSLHSTTVLSVNSIKLELANNKTKRVSDAKILPFSGVQLIAVNCFVN